MNPLYLSVAALSNASCAVPVRAEVHTRTGVPPIPVPADRPTQSAHLTAALGTYWKDCECECYL